MRGREVDAIARRQYGAFSRPQALAAGFTPRMIRGRLDAGEWVALDRCVYALASHPFTWERQAMAATLTVQGAAISGPSAAVLHGIDGFRRGAIEVTAPRSRNARSRLAVVRRSDFAQSTRIRGIPCLTVAHTILSLASRPVADLERAIDDVLVRRLVAIEELQDRFATWAPRRRPGVDSLRRLLLARGGGAAPPTSELERRLRALLQHPGIPTFEYEYELPWWPDAEGRVDAYSPELTLIVEADGRGWHARERDFVKDRQRDNLATANGHATLRFTWIDLALYRDANRDLVRKTSAARQRTASRAWLST